MLVPFLVFSFVIILRGSAEIREIPLTVEGRNFVIKHQDGDVIRDTAATFCRENGNLLGVSVESFMGCVTPIENYLKERIDSVLKAKTAPETSPDMVKVQVSIRGVDYEISFQKDSASINNAATAFCRENASAFGISEVTILSSCISPVTLFLRDSLESKEKPLSPQITDITPSPETEKIAENPDNAISIPMVVGEKGIKFEIQFNPSSVSSTTMAAKFCKEQAAALDISPDDIPGCVTSVAKYLQGVLDSRATQTSAEAVAPPPPRLDPEVSFQVTVSIGEKEYDITFQPNVVTTEAAATSFCQERGASFGITPETLGDCVSAVSAYLSSALRSRQSPASSTDGAPATAPETPAATALSVTIAVMGKEYVLTFQPTVSSPASEATAFCTERAEEFGLTKDNIEVCVTSVANVLVAAVAQGAEAEARVAASPVGDATVPTADAQEEDRPRRPRVDSAANALKVVLRVDQKDYDITFQPNVVTPEAAARTFCVEEGANFGVSASMLDECVTSVEKFLAEAVRANREELAANAAAAEVAGKAATPVVSEAPAAAAAAAAVPSGSVLTVTLNIQEKDYRITFPSDEGGIDRAASAFCEEHKTTFGLTANTLSDCVTPVAAYLAVAATRSKETETTTVTGAGAGAVEPKTFNITLLINGQNYVIDFSPEVASANATATMFCRQQIDAFQLTEATLQSCVGPVANYLVTATE